MTNTPPLILVPGLMCDAATWAAPIAGLADIAAASVPDVTGETSVTAMAEAALACVDGPFALAGHSLGGRIALEMVRLAPERVTRLALLDCGVGPVRPEEEPSRMALVAKGYDEGMEAVCDAWLPPMVYAGLHGDAALMGEMRAMVLRCTPERFERQQRALLTRPDADAGVAAIRCPTLVLVGRYDAWATVAAHEALAARIPGARLVVIEDAGHMAPMEQPVAVAAALRDWLAQPG